MKNIFFLTGSKSKYFYFKARVVQHGEPVTAPNVQRLERPVQKLNAQGVTRAAVVEVAEIREAVVLHGAASEKILRIWTMF